jgi:HTH-type transcriptional regulator/antitoxin HigA
MDVKSIRTDADHAAALAVIGRLWDAPAGSADADKLDVLATLIDAYEARRFPVEAPDPIAALRAHMEMTGRTQTALGELLGSRSRASEILHRRRALSVEMIHRISAEWGVPAERLVRPYALAAA